MPRFSVNLSFLFAELALDDRLDAAAEHGFRGVEYWSPYESDLGALRARLRKHDLEQVLFNFPMGDAAAGDRGMACRPDRIAEFRRGVGDAVTAARELDCTRLNCLAGVVDPNVPSDVTRATLVENLRFAADALAAIGATLLVEPLNQLDVPGFAVVGTASALNLIREVAMPNVALQYDCYHAQRSEGNLIETIRSHVDAIAHIQLADCPGRHEPGTGEIAFDRVLAEIDRSGYAGWVGLEYKPSLSVPETFSWITRQG